MIINMASEYDGVRDTVIKCLKNHLQIIDGYEDSSELKNKILNALKDMRKLEWIRISK